MAAKIQLLFQLYGLYVVFYFLSTVSMLESNIFSINWHFSSLRALTLLLSCHDLAATLPRRRHKAYFLHVVKRNVSFFAYWFSMGYEGYLQILPHFVQIIRLDSFVTRCVSTFCNLNVSFGDETDNSSYLAPLNALWQAETMLYFFIGVSLFFQKHCIPLQYRTWPLEKGQLS